jgi:hypothetical protein
LNFELPVQSGRRRGDSLDLAEPPTPLEKYEPTKYEETFSEEAKAKGYGKLYAAFGAWKAAELGEDAGRKLGLEACVAVENLCEVWRGVMFVKTEVWEENVGGQTGREKV